MYFHAHGVNAAITCILVLLTLHKVLDSSMQSNSFSHLYLDDNFLLIRKLNLPYVKTNITHTNTHTQQITKVSEDNNKKITESETCSWLSPMAMYGSLEMLRVGR